MGTFALFCLISVTHLLCDTSVRVRHRLHASPRIVAHFSMDNTLVVVGILTLNTHTSQEAFRRYGKIT